MNGEDTEAVIVLTLETGAAGLPHTTEGEEDQFPGQGRGTDPATGEGVQRDRETDIQIAGQGVTAECVLTRETVIRKVKEISLEVPHEADKCSQFIQFDLL